MAKKKLYGAAAKAHAKKRARGSRKSKAKKRKSPAKTSIVVHAANPKRTRRSRRRRSSALARTAPNPIRRRRRNPSGGGTLATGKVTSVKTWEKVGMQAVEAIAGGFGGGMAATQLEARLAQPAGTVGVAEIVLAALGILAGYKMGYPAVGLGFGAVAGTMGAKNLIAAHTTPAAPTASAAPATDPNAAAAAAGPSMGALTMGALVDEAGNDISGYEGIAAVQDASGTDDRGRSTYADVDDFAQSDEYAGSSFEG
jgi:hypothetical protein